MIESFASITETSAEQTGIAQRFSEISKIFAEAARSNYPESVAAAARLVVNVLRNGGKLLIFGNGGSAADAEHLCAELVVRFQTNRRALPAISLCSGSALMTACSNDFCYEDVFSRQVEALGVPGDLALGISTSGKSPNVVKALAAARSGGLSTILMTGPKLSVAEQQCDLVLHAPGPNTARVQELHLASYHVICEAIDDAFSGAEA